MTPVKTFSPLVQIYFAICENINTFDKENLKFYVRLKKCSIILRDLLPSGGK